MQTKNRITILALILTAMPVFWFWPFLQIFIQNLDRSFFFLSNGGLKTSNYLWLRLCFYCNHNVESWLNLIIMISLQIFLIIKKPWQQQKRLWQCFFYLWLCFQIILLLTNHFFSHILDIHRTSPSLQLKPFFSLSEYFQDNSIKEFSKNSFPAGHTLIAIYWLCWTLTLLKPKYIMTIIMFTIALILCFARAFSGAHWLSDILFTVLYSYMWFLITYKLMIKCQ